MDEERRIAMRDLMAALIVETDRGCALVGAAFIDEALAQILAEELPALRAKHGSDALAFESDWKLLEEGTVSRKALEAAGCEP